MVLEKAGMSNSKAFNYSFSLERKKRKAKLKNKTIPNETSSESCSLSWQWRALYFLFMGKYFGSPSWSSSREREPQGRFRDIFFITFQTSSVCCHYTEISDFYGDFNACKHFLWFHSPPLSAYRSVRSDGQMLGTTELEPAVWGMAVCVDSWAGWTGQDSSLDSSTFLYTYNDYQCCCF